MVRAEALTVAAASSMYQCADTDRIVFGSRQTTTDRLPPLGVCVAEHGVHGIAVAEKNCRKQWHVDWDACDAAIM
jgi:hypothetical protein